MKEKNKKILSASLAGAGGGMFLSTMLRLPIVGMLADYECPERGATTVTLGSGLLGGAIGAGIEIRRQKHAQDNKEDKMVSKR